MDDPIFDEDVDRSAERRLAVLRTVILAVVFTGLLVLLGLPAGTAATLATGTALVVLGRNLAIERFAFTQAQAYAKEIVGRHADVLLDVLRRRPDLADEYARLGLAVRALLACPPDAVRAAAQRLHAAGHPDRRLREPSRTLLRLFTVGAGATITVLLGRALASASVCSVTDLPGLWSAVTWQHRLVLVAGLVVVVLSRAGAAWYNRRELRRVSGDFARTAMAEVSAVLGRPWRARQAALIADLSRVLALVHTAGAIPDEALGLRRSSELRLLEWLFAAGLLAGGAVSLTVGC